MDSPGGNDIGNNGTNASGPNVSTANVPPNVSPPDLIRLTDPTLAQLEAIFAQAPPELETGYSRIGARNVPVPAAVAAAAATTATPVGPNSLVERVRASVWSIVYTSRAPVGDQDPDAVHPVIYSNSSSHVACNLVKIGIDRLNRAIVASRHSQDSDNEALVSARAMTNTMLWHIINTLPTLCMFSPEEVRVFNRAACVWLIEAAWRVSGIQAVLERYYADEEDRDLAIWALVLLLEEGLAMFNLVLGRFDRDYHRIQPLPGMNVAESLVSITKTYDTTLSALHIVHLGPTSETRANALESLTALRYALSTIMTALGISRSYDYDTHFHLTQVENQRTTAPWLRVLPRTLDLARVLRPDVFDDCASDLVHARDHGVGSEREFNLDGAACGVLHVLFGLGLVRR